MMAGQPLERDGKPTGNQSKGAKTEPDQRHDLKGAEKMKNMAEMVQELLELRRMKDELDSMISAVQGEITAAMELEALEEVTTATAKITWKPITTSRFDKAAYIRANGEDAYKAYCKSYSTRRFTVSA